MMNTNPGTERLLDSEELAELRTLDPETAAREAAFWAMPLEQQQASIVASMAYCHELDSRALAGQD
jgi:hypothetical protein